MGGIRAFLAELRRRHVFRVAAWYAVVSWLVIQVATQTFPALQLPDWTQRFVIVLCLLGFPVALVLAWAYELTPEGLRPAAPPAPETPITHWYGPSLWFAVAGGVLLGVGALQGWRAFVESVPEELGIAVMPFDNLSPDPNDAYFADGVHEELLSRLAALHGVRVISRTSVIAYRGLNKSAKEIGRELDVSHVLEGSVRRAGGRFLLTAQLIDARRDSHLWTENYEGEITEVFAAQRDVATRIVAELKHRLTDAEVAVVGNVPTQDAEAYALYQRGKQILDATGDYAANARRSRPLLEAAIARDPSFALAHAALSKGYSTEAWHTRNPDLVRPAAAHAQQAPEVGAGTAWIASSDGLRELLRQFRLPRRRTELPTGVSAGSKRC